VYDECVYMYVSNDIYVCTYLFILSAYEYMHISNDMCMYIN